MKTLAVLLVSLPLCAQSAGTSAPIQTPSSAKPALPNWAGCGASFSDPGWAGWCALAIPAVVSQQIYSYTMYSVLPNGSKTPTITTTTGGAIIIRQFPLAGGTLNIIGLGTVGVAVSSTATTGSFAGGGLALWKAKAGWTFEVGGIQTKAGTINKPELIAGTGWTW